MGAFKKWLGMGGRKPREDRALLVAIVERELGGIDPRYAEALLDVPRERFVRPEHEGRAAEDVPLPLDDAGLSTISAPHAYVLSFALAHLAPGDRVLELGSGTGYGAALAAHVVGSEGRVTTIEIDPLLAARARELLAATPNVTALAGDAAGAWPSDEKAPNKVLCTFAVERIPDAWLARLPEGGVLVAPVGPRDATQRLVRVERTNGELVTTKHGAVRYVPNRSVS